MLTSATKSYINTGLKDFQHCEKLVVSVWKYPENSGAGIKIISNFNRRISNFVQENIVARDTTGWVKIESAITIPAGFGASEIEVMIFNTGQAPAWVDDIEVIREGL